MKITKPKIKQKKSSSTKFKNEVSNCLVLSAPALLILFIYIIYFPDDSIIESFTVGLKNANSITSTIVLSNSISESIAKLTNLKNKLNVDDESEIVYMVVSRRRDVSLRKTIRETWAKKVTDAYSLF